MFRLRFPLDQIPRWAARYSYDDSDGVFLSEVRPAVRRRGYLTTPEFRAICYWKTPRSQSRCRLNGSDEIRTITRAALATGDESLKMDLLRLLHGVDWPTASTILHFCDRRAFPILDYRALWSLVTPGRRTTRCRSGWAMSATCATSRRGRPPMRTVDRALWQYSWPASEGSPRSTMSSRPCWGSAQPGLRPRRSAYTGRPT